MWNAKRKNLFLTICLVCSVVICFALLPSCRNKNEAVWMEHFVPPADETVAILLVSWHYKGGYLALFGDKELAEKRTGHPLESAKIFEGRDWLEKIMDAYEIALKEGEKKEFSSNEPLNSGVILFMTPKKIYARTISINKDENTVYDRYMKSTLLKKYFDELGLTDEISKPEFEVDYWNPGEKFYIPPTDQARAILLYSPHNTNLLHTPLALFGDKEVTEKLTGMRIEPEKIIEGREWLEKMMEAFRIAFKEVRGEELPAPLDFRCGWVVFITQNRGYVIAGSNFGGCAAYYDYMSSGLLKKYFDELGLTKELLAGEPNKVAQN